MTSVTGDRRKTSAAPSVESAEAFDYITGSALVRLNDGEKVRQWIGRVLAHQYGIHPADMESDFAISVVDEATGRTSRRRASIAVFEEGKPHEAGNIRRVVVTKPRPKAARASSRSRTGAESKERVDEVAALMRAAGPQCTYGLWADGQDIHFIHRVTSSSQATYLPVPSWPRSDAPGAVSSPDIARPGEATMLGFAFRRCFGYLHANEGLSRDAAFWQFLYVLFAKAHDERLVRDQRRAARFSIGANGPAEEEPGLSGVAARIGELFEEAKAFHADQGLFGDQDRLTLGEGALAFIVSELAACSILSSSPDALGAAYQELAGDCLRGDHGQFFTPSSAVRLMVEILDPAENETVLDPSCGTGGFLSESLLYALHKWEASEDTEVLTAREQTRLEISSRLRLREYARDRVFGADIDPALARAAAVGVMLLSDVAGNTFQMDSLGFPWEGSLPGVERARQHLHRIGPGTVDVLLTNPPYGADIPVTGPVLDLFREDRAEPTREKPSVAYTWTRSKDGRLRRGMPASSVAPERLFVQKAIEWVRPGGRIGMVLPNGMLSNPGPDDEAVRQHILSECWLMASIELPVEAFIVGAGVNVLTTLLFLRKKTDAEKAEELANGPVDYPLFMAVAEKVGHDRRGNPLFVRDARGDVVVREYEEAEDIVVSDVTVRRAHTLRTRILDDDLMSLRERPGGHDRPSVITEYLKFVHLHAGELPWNTPPRQ
ncbi:methylation-associated defense system DNA methyltransferase MAD2 [Streptomyces sp. bgisy154]|uniref:methylation-associated defense system DNA methyltransferase MAD2 n=1 Tax=Streptomyces sp. bgisy154 TaxID=3413794 RepID=UPI003D71FED9